MLSVLLSVFPLRLDLRPHSAPKVGVQDGHQYHSDTPLFIQDLCLDDNPWQQQLCTSTYLSMLENDVSAQEILIIHRTQNESTTVNTTPDDLALKEWVRLLSVQ